MRENSIRVPFLFLFPALAGLVIFKLYPMVLAAKDSLYVESFISNSKIFVGFENYIDLFNDPVFIDSLKVTIWFNLLINPIQIVMAVLLAILANQVVRGINAFRTLFYVPVGISVSIASVIWGLLLNPNHGFVNSLLALVGISPQPFLVDSKQALFSIILISSWIGISYWMIFVLAALQEIPAQLYEAARIDGASGLQAFLRITLPMLKRSIAFIAVGATTSNFLLFAPSYILTRGGPSGSTNLLMHEAYLSAFSYSDMGRSSAIVMILLAITLAVVFAELRLLQGESI